MSEETSESPAFGDVSAAVEPVASAFPDAVSMPDAIVWPPGFARFQSAARSLKAAEDALIAARQVYAEAVKALSEEAVK